MLICPGLAGPDRKREYAYAERLARRGYPAMVIDPYTARGVGWLPDPLRALRVGPAMMLADAFSALAFLRRHPAVGPERPVALMGFSYGAMISVLAAQEAIARRFAPEGARFAGHVAYYGPSAVRLEDPRATGAPVLMMVAELDRNVSLARTAQIADDLRRGGAPVELHVVRGVYHAWDGPHRRRKHVLFSMHDCRFVVSRDGVLREEASRRPLPGQKALVLALLRRMRIAGYHMQRDDAAARWSDDRLYGFLDGLTVATTAVAPRPAAAALRPRRAAARPPAWTEAAWATGP